MLPWTVLIKYHLQAHQHTIEVIPPVGAIDPHLGIIATTGIPRDQDPDSTPVHSDSSDEEEEDFQTVPLDYEHWTSEEVPERTFCIHKNGLPHNSCQYPCPYGSNDTVSYMDSLDENIAISGMQKLECNENVAISGF